MGSAWQICIILSDQDVTFASRYSAPSSKTIDIPRDKISSKKARWTNIRAVLMSCTFSSGSPPWFVITNIGCGIQNHLEYSFKDLRRTIYLLGEGILDPQGIFRVVKDMNGKSQFGKMTKKHRARQSPRSHHKMLFSTLHCKMLGT